MNCLIDMYDQEPYTPSKHIVPRIYWNDSRMHYWGWIYDRAAKIVGDFQSSSVQAAEKALKQNFICH